MGIQIMHTVCVTCDQCENGFILTPADEAQAAEVAKALGWLVEEEFFFCPDCKDDVVFLPAEVGVDVGGDVGEDDEG